MKLWLARRFGRPSTPDPSAAAPGHALSITMGIESLEHMVRNRVMTFLRHTWLVTILGTVIIAAGIGAAIYITTAPTDMRIAAGPSGGTEAKFVQVLAQKFAKDRDNIQLRFVATAGAQESAQALTKGSADLAVLPSTIGNSPNWPVVAILRQNVMALIVPPPPPAPAPAVTAKKEPSPPAKKEAGAAEKKEKTAKRGKEAKGHNTKTAKGKSDKVASNDKNAKSVDSAKDDDTDASDDTGSETADAGKKPEDTTNKLEKVPQLAGKRIGIVTGNAATKDLLDVVLNHYGVPPDKVQVSLIDPKNLADAVKAKEVDAIFVAGSATGQAFTDAVAAASQNGQASSPSIRQTE
jgi:ABC-type nitrate/sulfonate/bicarbonate transport system substrate-binding protein